MQSGSKFGGKRGVSCLSAVGGRDGAEVLLRELMTVTQKEQEQLNVSRQGRGEQRRGVQEDS